MTLYLKVDAWGLMSFFKIQQSKIKGVVGGQTTATFVFCSCSLNLNEIGTWMWFIPYLIIKGLGSSRVHLNSYYIHNLRGNVPFPFIIPQAFSFIISLGVEPLNQISIIVTHLIKPTLESCFSQVSTQIIGKV